MMARVQHLKQMKEVAPHLSIFTNIMHQDYFSEEENVV